VYAAALIGYLVLLRSPLPAPALRLINDAAWTVSCILAVLASLYVSRQAGGRLRRFWRLLATAAGCWLAGQLIWDWNEIRHGALTGFPNAADGLFVLFPLLTVVALITLKDPNSTPQLIAGRVGNLLLMICALAMGFVMALLEPLSASGQSAIFQAAAVAGFLIIAGGFLFSVYFLWSYRWGLETAPLTLLVLGAATHSATTLAYMRQLLTESYSSTSIVNAGWALAFLLQCCAAHEQFRIIRSKAGAADNLAIARRQWVEAALPGVLLALIALTAFGLRLQLTPRVITASSALFVIFAVGVTIRDLWIHRHEVRLRRRLSHTNRELHEAKTRLEATLQDLGRVEERFRMAVQAGNVGLWDWDLLQGTAYYSPEWQRQLGYADGEIPGSPREWRARLHADDAERASSFFVAPSRDTRAELRFEHRMRQRDGSYRWMLTQASFVFDAEGRPVRLLGSQVDISSQKLAEEALRESEARLRELARDLEKRVVERTAQLQDAYSELESFAYAVSHDLKAPLRAIDGFSYLLLERYGEKLDDSGRAQLGRVRRGAAHMASLIDGLLAYSRMERRELHEDEIDIPKLAHAVLDEYGEQLRESGAQIKLDVPAAIVRADREGFALVLRNFLGNAIKFTRDTSKPAIELGGKVESGLLTLWVRDNGIGFDPQYHDQIFKIFQRLHRMDEYSGTGIGLALARKAVQRMRGRIWAESEPEHGATFFIELPATQPLGSAIRVAASGQ
jgi:PAS domain S-box-containing protein